MAQLEFILEDHRRFYADNFEAPDPSMQQEDMNGEYWESYILPAQQPRQGHRNAANPPPKARPCRPAEAEMAIAVMDPFSRGRNLCSSCPSSFRREGVLQHLQTVFCRGLLELSAVVDTPLKGAAEGAAAAQDLLGAPEKKLLRNERDILGAVFPWTYALICARREESPHISARNNLVTVFRAVCLNAPLLSSYEAAHPSDFSGRFREAMFYLEAVISRALKLSTNKVVPNSIYFHSYNHFFHSV
jgi:hypothetical protein